MKRIRGRAFVRGRIEEDVLIGIDEGKIVDLKVNPTVPHSSETDLRNALILPGLIDLHVHGAAGADFMDATPESVGRITTYHALHGTAALAATTLSGSAEAIRKAITTVASARSSLPSSAAEIAGIHMEGPYLSHSKAGAQDRSSLRNADLHEVESFLAAASGLRCIMTIAPEIEGVHAVMEKFKKQILFSIGHTEAGYSESLQAVLRGAGHFTHLFNAMLPLHHRDPGAVGAALISHETTAEIIADGVHVHPILLRTMATMMPNRLVLVTDAIRACGMPEGTYKLYEYDVNVREGAARLSDGTLAGSVLTMIRAVQNMVELAGLPMEGVVPMATEIPARILQIDDRKGKIELGYDADLVAISPRFEIVKLFLRGVEIEPR